MEEDADIPTILTADELLDKAFRRASKIRIPDRDKLYRDRKTAVAKLDSVADSVQNTLRKYVKAFPTIDEMHPFHRELLGLGVDLGHLKRSLGALTWCGSSVRRIAASQARTLRRTKDLDFVARKMEETYGRIASVIKQVRKDLEFVGQARLTLNALPSINPQEPVIVIAGPPNSGKSQLVRNMSSGKPEVAQYPFTTKAVSLGHFKQRYVRCVVIDTPGLLDRPYEKRNDIERQAILALKYLSDVIVYIIDPTCIGVDMDSQMHLLREIERDFGDRADIIKVYGKCDITDEGDLDIPRISGKTGEGVEALREKASELARKRRSDVMFDQ